MRIRREGSSQRVHQRHRWMVDWPSERAEQRAGGRTEARKPPGLVGAEEAGNFHASDSQAPCPPASLPGKPHSSSHPCCLLPPKPADPSPTLWAQAFVAPHPSHHILQSPVSGAPSESLFFQALPLSYQLPCMTFCLEEAPQFLKELPQVQESEDQADSLSGRVHPPNTHALLPPSFTDHLQTPARQGISGQESAAFLLLPQSFSGLRPTTWTLAMTFSHVRLPLLSSRASHVAPG